MTEMFTRIRGQGCGNSRFRRRLDGISLGSSGQNGIIFHGRLIVSQTLFVSIQFIDFDFDSRYLRSCTSRRYRKPEIMRVWKLLSIASTFVKVIIIVISKHGKYYEIIAVTIPVKITKFNIRIKSSSLRAIILDFLISSSRTIVSRLSANEFLYQRKQKREIMERPRNPLLVAVAA